MPGLRFGTFLAPSILPVYEAVAAAVGRGLGVATEIVEETSYAPYLSDRNDVSFVCSLAHIVFERRGLSTATPVAAPVLSGSRYRGAPIYFSDVIVHRESPIQSFLDLRGLSWAFNEQLSHSGYGITRFHLVRIGETTGFFGKVVEAGYHRESIRMVMNREIDASAIDSQLLAVAMRDDPELRKSLRVVAALGPSSIQPVVISNRIDVGLRNDIVEVLLSLHDDSASTGLLAAGMVERFVSMDTTSYADIREMLDTCEKADFMEIT